MDCCCFLTFERSHNPKDEWVPMGLRPSICTLRSRNPERYAAKLREAGIEVDDDNVECLHNLDGTWPRCPLFAPRGFKRSKR